jgi:hypothetical protein
VVPISNPERAFGLRLLVWVVAIFLSGGVAALLYLYGPSIFGEGWLGYVVSAITGIILFVVLLILGYKLMARYDPSTVTEYVRTRRSGQKVVRPCPVGPHVIQVGELKEFDLNVGAGDLMVGEICDVYEQPFNWYLLDNAGVESFRRNESYAPVDYGTDEVSYKVEMKIPSNGFWSIVIDLSGREKERCILLDLEVFRA